MTELRSFFEQLLWSFLEQVCYFETIISILQCSENTP